MTVPSEFVGVWERVELVVDGRTVFDAGRSFWFQSRSEFLDVRAAGGGLQSEAFGGVTKWDPATATLTWSHDIDMHPESPTDCGRVEWRGPDLVEYGTAEVFDETIEYCEVWRRRTDSTSTVYVADRIDGIGRMAWCEYLSAVTIDDRPAGTLQGGVCSDRGWAWVFDIVQGKPLASISDVLPTHLTESDEFTRWGHTWRLSP